MAGSNAVVVKFIADTRQMSKGIDKVNTQLGGFSKAMKGVGGAVAGAFAASKVVYFCKEIVSLSSQMEQVAGTAQTLFGPEAARRLHGRDDGSDSPKPVKHRATCRTPTRGIRLF